MVLEERVEGLILELTTRRSSRGLSPVSTTSQGKPRPQPHSTERVRAGMGWHGSTSCRARTSVWRASPRIRSPKCETRDIARRASLSACPYARGDRAQATLTPRAAPRVFKTSSGAVIDAHGVDPRARRRTRTSLIANSIGRSKSIGSYFYFIAGV